MSIRMSTQPSNDVASLRQGIVKPAKNRKEFTILLVGETGVGKTSVLSLIGNVLGGRKPEQYTDFHDPTNEAGGSQKGSQTNTAKVYEFESRNGVIIRVLDTPGLADTRGLDMDKRHKQSIARAIEQHINTVNAVLILANGTLARLGVATEYALSALSSIFPHTLANNIGIMFTNVSDPLDCNFEEGSLPDVLTNARQFLLDNPVAIQKKLREQKKKGVLPKAIAKMQRRMQDSEEMAFEVLTELFDWLNGLVPQPTKEIVSLHEKSQNIQKKIDSAFARMKQAADKERELEKIEAALNKAKVDLTTYKDFESVVTKPVHIQKNTSQHNTLCSFPGCYSNCHESCGLDFSLKPSDLEGCIAMTNGMCKCGHRLESHRHYNCIWALEDDRQVVVDPTAKVKFESAKDEKTRKEQLMAAVQEARDELTKGIDEETNQLGKLVTEYAGLSLSGSFSGQVDKSVKLMELNVQKLHEEGAKGETVEKMEASLWTLRGHLDLLRKAEAMAKSGVRQFFSAVSVVSATVSATVTATSRFVNGNRPSA